ncbi:hypothetical protein NN561_015725 [Cricetulus griseus]
MSSLQIAPKPPGITAGSPGLPRDLKAGLVCSQTGKLLLGRVALAQRGAGGRAAQRGTATLWSATASPTTARSIQRRTRAWGQAAAHVRRNALCSQEQGRGVPAPVTWVSNRQQPMAARVRWRVRSEARGKAWRARPLQSKLARAAAGDCG